MANLKSGTLIGGNMIWHAGNMPFDINGVKFLVGGNEVYTKANRPTPAEVGAVSKAGDTMSGNLTIENNAPILKLSETDSGGKSYFIVTDGGNLRINVNNTSTTDETSVFEWNDSTKEFGIRNNLYVKGEARLNNLKLVGAMTIDNKYVKGANNAIVMRDHGNGNVTISASVNADSVAGDLYLGYNSDASGTAGYRTRRILLRSPTYWGNSAHVLFDDNGLFNSERMVGPIRTEKDSANITHTVVGGTDTVNRGRLLLAAGECGKIVHENTSTGDEVAHIAADASAGVWIHTGLQSGWGHANHKKYNFKAGDLYVDDGTKRVFRQGWDFGLGGRQGAGAIAKDYTEDTTRDFNKLIAAGEYGVSGDWLNGVTNVATAVSHTGTVKVEIRHWSSGPAYVQTYTNVANGLVRRKVRYGDGSYPNINWRPWAEFGNYEVELGHRLTINRTNSTGAAYITLKKRETRTDMTSGWYNFGTIDLKVGDGTYDPNNPNAGDLGATVSAARQWDNQKNRLLLQLRKATENKTISEVVLYEDNARFTCNGKVFELRDTGQVNAPGQIQMVGKLLNNAFASSNKQILNANGSDYVYVGNPTVKKLYIETDANGEVYVNANTSAKRVYHEGYKPSIAALGLTGKIVGAPQTLAKEDLNDIKTAGVYAQNANANTPGLNYPEERAGTLTVTVAAGTQQRYHVYNTSNIYTRAQYSTGGWTAWQRNITTNDVNMSGSGAWSSVINKIPRIHSDGVMEVARYIDMHRPDSTADFDIRLECEENSLAVYTKSGGIQIGAMNSSYAHIYTDRASFYMNKGLTTVGAIESKGDVISSNNVTMKSGGRRHIIFADQSGNTADGFLYKDPGSGGFVFNHGTINCNTVFSSNGEAMFDGYRWAETHSHAYGGQPGIGAPLTVEFGSVAGSSDYYPIVRGISQSAGYGYTTQIDLGVIRQGGASWGQGVLRVGSHESAAHPQGIIYFDISGNLSASGNVTAFSDVRVKKNIETIENALDKIDQIRGVTYDRTDMDVPRQMGVIAQEVEKVAPEVIVESIHGDLEDFKGVAYGNLSALLIEGIKELRSELREIKAHLGL
ncbi:MAG: tail fiber domain-containing protein [Aeromonas veronii]